jgi:outer membrane receptor for ferrienterochelin and colicins
MLRLIIVLLFSFLALQFSYGQYTNPYTDSSITLPSIDTNAAAIVSDSIPANSLALVQITDRPKSLSIAKNVMLTERYHASFFQKNISPSLFDALQNINGVRPQINCNVCNTGDIHINGMEGAYTTILIDGMPIVSALASVYGLSAIPNSMIASIEINKGPANVEYGSEAIGGVINIITKNPIAQPNFTANVYTTNWAETNADLSYTQQFKKISSLWSLNYYHYQNPKDDNQDGFTDMALQKRFSFFNKWKWERKQQRIANMAFRYVQEHRWGGDMEWNTAERGLDHIYGESIYTKRWEWLAQYQLPMREHITLQTSVNNHHQDAAYGTNVLIAEQRIIWNQLKWQKNIQHHQLTLGATAKHTYYQDNIPLNFNQNENTLLSNQFLPSMYIQDEWTVNTKHSINVGYRLDIHKLHGLIHSPRFGYLYKWNTSNQLRFNIGSGFRIVNVFNEDHAALTGARSVEIAEQLQPEKSLNILTHYLKNKATSNGFLQMEASLFYNYFFNKIVPDYSQQQKIIYSNLKGYAVSAGASIQIQYQHQQRWNFLIGFTYLDAYQMQENDDHTQSKSWLYYTPKWTGNATVSYNFPMQITVDVTALYNSPMRLPIQELDYRPEQSPPYMIANLQTTKKWGKRLETYIAIKNLFHFKPQHTYMRPFDPFNKTADDKISNPNGYVFDTEYNYAAQQGRRLLLGIRFQLQNR